MIDLSLFENIDPFIIEKVDLQSGWLILVSFFLIILVAVILPKQVKTLRDFDIHFEIEREVKRREILLGKLLLEMKTEETYKKELTLRRAIRKRAHEVRVPFKTFYGWYTKFQHDKINGLKETGWIKIWNELTPEIQALALERYFLLGEYADSEILLESDIEDLAKHNNWKFRTAQEWLRRYREGGIIGLCPKHDPYKRKPLQKAKISIGSLINSELEKIFELQTLLGDLAEKDHASTEEVNRRAEEVGLSSRTIWYKLKEYKNSGLSGWARKVRQDKGKCHSISEIVQTLIICVRLSRKSPTITMVHEQVCKRAKAIGELPPSKPAVRKVISQMSGALLALADGKENVFRNKFRATHDLIIDPNKVILFLDATQIDVLVKDNRDIKYRTKSGEIRPWLTIALEANSRVELAYLLTYDVPDRFTVATLIYEAIQVTQNKWYGGGYDEVWTDQGKAFIADLIKQITFELKAIFNKLPPHSPTPKGRVENMFERLNNELWKDTEGYVGPDVKTRDPNVQAKYSISEIDEKLGDYFDKYNNNEHSSLNGLSPLEYWENYLFPEEIPSEVLSSLLMERKLISCYKGFIRFKRTKYWNGILAKYAGEKVMIKWGFSYDTPKSIEVFTPAGEWICKADDENSKEGKLVTVDDISKSQKSQRGGLRKQINDAKYALKQLDAKHNISDENAASRNEVPASQTHEKPKKTKKTTTEQEPSLISLRSRKISDRGVND